MLDLFLEEGVFCSLAVTQVEGADRLRRGQLVMVHGNSGWQSMAIVRSSNSKRAVLAVFGPPEEFTGDDIVISRMTVDELAESLAFAFLPEHAIHLAS